MTSIDREVLARLREDLGGEAAVLKELVDTFDAEARRLVVDLEEAAKERNLERLQRAAHTLKSTSATFGAMGLSERCKRLEADARAGRIANAKEAVDAIAEAFQAVRAELTSALDQVSR